MKRVFVLLLVSLMTFGLTACKKASDNSIVVGKDNTLMLNKASGNGKEEKSIADMLQAPERMVLSVTDSKGDVSADADAVVLLPDTDSIAVVRVRGRDFSQEEADRVLAYFIGETAFNDRYEAGYTSEEERLMRWIEELSKETDSAERESIQQSIDKFKSMGIEVPDKPHEVLPASKVFEPTKNGATQIKGYSKDGDNHKFLIIFNNLAENKNMLLYTCEQKGFADIGHEGSYSTNKTDLNKFGFEAAQQLPLAISPEDAMRKAEEALSALNISDMKLYSCEEVWGGTFLSGGTVKQQEHHAYRLEFVRSIGGALLTYTKNNIDRTTVQIDEKSGERLAESWPYERIMFIIDDTGIVEFLWESPYEVTEQVIEDASLMPFEDIEAVFSRMILVTHGQHDEGVKLNFNIDRVQLGMMRIQDGNSPKTGLIVPVWDFFGTMTIGGHKLPDEHISYLTINAIDGSIIDRMKGY